MIANDIANDALNVWTVYDHPSDQPDHFVARLWQIKPDSTIKTNEVIIGKTLEDIRVRLSRMGLSCVARDPNDDPVIVETWF